MYTKFHLPERATPDETFVFSPTLRQPVVLAATAALIWRALDTTTSQTELIEVLAATYPAIDRATLVETANQVLSNFEEWGLLERP